MPLRAIEGGIHNTQPNHPTACDKFEDDRQYIFRSKFDEVETVDGIRNMQARIFHAEGDRSGDRDALLNRDVEQ